MVKRALLCIALAMSAGASELTVDNRTPHLDDEITITLIVAAAVVLIAVIIFVAALIHVPVAAFFPTYALYFFAGRYAPLHDRLFPPPPAAPVPETPPEPPPTPEPLAT